MKKLVFIFSLLIASISFAANTSDVVEKTSNSKCTSTITSTVTQNPDGSSTRTTTTNVSCDTAEELAAFHAGMAALGMGV